MNINNLCSPVNPGEIKEIPIYLLDPKSPSDSWVFVCTNRGHDLSLPTI